MAPPAGSGNRERGTCRSQVSPASGLIAGGSARAPSKSARAAAGKVLMPASGHVDHAAGDAFGVALEEGAERVLGERYAELHEAAFDEIADGD